MAFKGVLFDWRGTLFHDTDAAEWVRSSAASIGRQLSDAEVARINEAIDRAAADPEVVEAQRRYDASVELHRAGGLLHFRKAGLDDELVLAIYERDGMLDASLPYPDTEPTLRRLKELGLRIVVVSDINFDLRPFFEHYGMADCIDGYALSYEHGWVKPEPAAFETALRVIGLDAADVLMVGDRASHDGGAAAYGIATLILPPVPDYAVRGLDAVVRLCG